jgi:hypothetical protein
MYYTSVHKQGEPKVGEGWGRYLLHTNKMIQIFRKFTCFMADVINQVEMSKHTCGSTLKILKKIYSWYGKQLHNGVKTDQESVKLNVLHAIICDSSQTAHIELCKKMYIVISYESMMFKSMDSYARALCQFCFHVYRVEISPRRCCCSANQLSSVTDCTYLLTELSPSSEAANCAPTQELPSNLWNPKVLYRVHKSPPFVPILSQINLLHTIPSYLSKIYFKIVRPHTSWSS